MNTPEEKRLELVERFHKDRHLAHDVLFPQKRKNKSPPFHTDILRALYSDERFVLIKAFRGAAKSTLTEEYATLCAEFKEFKYIIIVGNSYERACERLAAIKHELEVNDELIEVFGDQKGPSWTIDSIILKNGTKIQAFGNRQSMRGAKHNDQRPDCAILDDIEDEDMVLTEESRKKTLRWVESVLIPALTPDGKVRMLGTPLHPEGLVERFVRSKQWITITVPICYLDENGNMVPSWPDRFSMKWINDLRNSYEENGSIIEFEQEYMCRAEDVANKPFQASMIKHGPTPVGYTSTEIIVDPARTTNKKTSARTGYAVYSWVGGKKLFVHEAFGAFDKPDAIIDTIFRLNEVYNPVFVGVEATGLEEFIMQPLRHEMVKRGITVPIVPVIPPQNKDAFITGLQPFYTIGDVTHSDQCKDLENELVAFPTGRKDVINALAYAIKMRSLKPVYEDFGPQHVVDGLEIHKRAKRYLAVSSTPTMTAAVLLQYRDGNLYILRDWCKSEPPRECLAVIMQEALLEGGEFTAVAPLEQLDKYTNNGIPAVFKNSKYKILRGPSAQNSVGILTNKLKTMNKNVSAFQVNSTCFWVLNGMSKGYGFKMQKTGSYAEAPEKNQYSLVMEALESFSAYINNGMQEDDDELVWSTTANGRPFISALPKDRK